jgi:ligand-binding sensor domain-containing protein
MKLADRKLERIKGFKIVAEQFISSLLMTNNTMLVASHSGGIYKYHADTISRWTSQVNRDFAQRKIDKALNMNDSVAVISLNTDGIVATNTKGDVLLHLNKANGLVDNTVTNLYVDDNQNLWLTTLNGISFVKLFKPYSTLSATSGITGIAYSSVVDQHTLYLGTSEGLFAKDLSVKQRQEQFKKVDEIAGLVWHVSAYNNTVFCGHVSSAFVVKDRIVEKITDHGTWIFLPLSNTNYMLVGTYAGLEIWENKNDRWLFRNAVKGRRRSQARGRRR